MRVLYLTQVLPYPLDAGPKVRAYHTLSHLVQKNDITLLSFVRPSDSPAAVEHLRSLCSAVYTVPIRRSRFRDAWHLARSLLGQTPFLVARDWIPEMDQMATELMRRRAFDFIHADQLWMAKYALRAATQSTTRASVRLVLDQHNAVFQIPLRMAEYESNVLKRLFLRLEASKLVRFESRTCREFNDVVWVTKEDRDALRAAAKETASFRESVIPIGVDLREGRLVLRNPSARRVTFMGGLHWPPNAEGILWFARECWPEVLNQVPDARLTIIGARVPAALLSASIPNCEVTGYVSDPSPYLAETGVFIVPLHAGSGMRVKILDAWANGLPTVSTRIGAEGIAYTDGEDLLLADSANQFAHSVVRILQEPAAAMRLSISCRRTVEKLYDRKSIYTAWDSIYSTARPTQLMTVA